jgi:hypothetical protein
MSTSLSIFIAKTEGKAKVKNRLVAQSQFLLGGVKYEEIINWDNMFSSYICFS